MITITSKQEGFRRAGIAHSIAPKSYPDNKFTADQLAALKAEPMLTVKQVAGKPEKQDDPKSKK